MGKTYPSLLSLLVATLIIIIPQNGFCTFPFTNLKSNILEYRQGIYTASGNVVIIKDNKKLTASSVTLNNNTGDVTASGNVELTDGDNTMSSEKLYFNLQTSIARIEKGKIFIKQDNYHFEGDSIERLSEDRFTIRKANFTTCDGTPPCWRFKGQNVHIHLNHLLTASGVSMSVKDIPVLYFPYIALPILQERQTGLLIPRIGYNTSEGLKINNAFFWAISRSQDATFYADYYGEKGWGSGLEYRYILSQENMGKFNGYYINDHQLDRNRWNVKFTHKQLFSEDMSGRLRINYINDKTLYKDISEDIGERLQTTQDSDVYFNRRWANVSGHLWAQYTQNLTGKSDGIYQRLPEAGLRVMESRISKTPIYWGLASSASRWEETNTGLTRLQFAPKISARLLEWTGFIFIPEAGTENTFYIADGKNESLYSNQYNLNATLTTKLFRLYESGTGFIEHFIEPAIRYEYSEVSSKGSPPILDQNPPLPVMKNLISLSLLNRVLSPDRDLEMLYLKLTQLYRITSPDPDISPLPFGERVRVRGFSDLRIEAIVRPHEMLTIDTDTTYSFELNEVKTSGTDLEVRGNIASIGIGQRYSKYPKLKFLTAFAGLRLNKVDTTIDVWYDDKDNLVRESNYSMKYTSQCWGVTFSYKYRPEEKQFSVLLTLRGVGSVGR
ncbi:MAG: LPS-assembly protein LptD [Nitrospirae bacterium]|nr:LPS-assembly protein LptD [Nitrospirota bacterium]